MAWWVGRTQPQRDLDTHVEEDRLWERVNSPRLLLSSVCRDASGLKIRADSREGKEMS